MGRPLCRPLFLGDVDLVDVEIRSRLKAFWGRLQGRLFRFKLLS